MSLADAATAAEEEIDWVVRNLLAAGEKAVIAGPPKSLKTWLALNLAKTVAVGGLFLDEGEWSVEAPQPVIFIQEEGAHQRWAQRLVGAFAGNLAAPFSYTHRGGFSLVDRGQMTWLELRAAEAGARLIVIDPLQRVTPGVKENDASETGPAWDAIHALASRTGAAVVVLHHARKGDGEPTMDSIRGSSRIAGEVDLIAVVRKRAQGRLEMYLEGRDLVRGHDNGNLEISYDPDDPHLMRTTGMKLSTPQTRKSARDAAGEALRASDAPISTAEVRTQVVSILGEDRSRQAVARALDDLAEAGTIRKDGLGKGRSATWEWIDA